MNKAASRVLIYGADWCPYCKKAQELFKNLNVKFEYVNTDENPQVKLDLYKKHNWKTIPMIFIDGDFKGGLSDVQEKMRSGKIVLEEDDE